MQQTGEKWWVGKVIHWELCKRLKFEHAKPESALINELHKIPKNFEIQIDHRIPTRTPDLDLINKKKELVIWWILLFQRTTE